MLSLHMNQVDLRSQTLEAVDWAKVWLHSNSNLFSEFLLMPFVSFSPPPYKRPTGLTSVLFPIALFNMVSIPRMLKYWRPLPPEEALELLDAKFADQHVRHYAVQRLSLLSDQEVWILLPLSV